MKQTPFLPLPAKKAINKNSRSYHAFPSAAEADASL